VAHVHTGRWPPRILRLLLAALVNGAAGCCPDSLYELLVPVPAALLPEDESPHCSGGEWWYYTGRVATAGGRAFGVEAVIFHVPAHVSRLPAEVYVSHFAVLDESSGAFTYDQSRAADPPGICCRGLEGFDLETPLVRMTGFDGQDHLRAAMADGTYAMDLMLVDERGPVLHGGDGHVPYGLDGRSFYYSRPRMAAQGTLTIDGVPEDVTGEFWFDRQWGRDLTNPFLRWNWFSLRLDDGSSVMLFVFRDEIAPAALGTYVPAEGDAVHLADDDFRLTPTAGWTSPHTGATYPIGLEIDLPDRNLHIVLTPVAEDQELDVRATTLNV